MTQLSNGTNPVIKSTKGLHQSKEWLLPYWQHLRVLTAVVSKPEVSSRPHSLQGPPAVSPLLAVSIFVDTLVELTNTVSEYIGYIQITLLIVRQDALSNQKSNPHSSLLARPTSRAALCRNSFCHKSVALLRTFFPMM